MSQNPVCGGYIPSFSSNSSVEDVTIEDPSQDLRLDVVEMEELIISWLEDNGTKIIEDWLKRKQGGQVLKQPSSPQRSTRLELKKTPPKRQEWFYNPHSITKER